MANKYTPTSASKGTDVDGLGGTPDAHAASHASGGSDPITADDIGALAVTELNKPVHGLNMDGEVISGLGEPSADDHAATKGYVDTAVAAAGAAPPDVITPTITPGAWTSGQHTVLLTVTDSLGAPRIGTPVRLTHTSTGGAYSVGSINLGTALASQQNPANTAGFLLAATDYLGRVQALWNGPPGTITTVTAVVLSEAPASLALTPFVGP